MKTQPGIFEVNTQATAIKVDVRKFTSPHDPLPRYNVYSSQTGILLGESLTLTQVRRMMLDNGYALASGRV